MVGSSATLRPYTAARCSCPGRRDERGQERSPIIDLTIEQSERGPWTLISVAGEIDLFTSPQLRERVLASAAGDGVLIALDFSQVGFVDSSGLGVIVACLKHLRENGGDLAVISPDGSAFAKLLALTGLDGPVRRVPSASDLL